MKNQRFSRLLKAISRKKVHECDENTQLAKVLSTFDLTILAIGSTLGVGVYVLAGEVAKNYAGPSVVISFLIAAIASLFAGLCFAEVGVRVPKAGSTYVYSYVCIGELAGFLVGWNLILEYIIGAASVVKGLFTYLDALFNHAMSTFLRYHMPINLQSFARYPDFFSLAITCTFSVALAFGAKESFVINNVFTVVNVLVVLFVIISGLWKINIGNWSIPKDKVPEGKFGVGGFIPYGLSGILKGAPACFYGFIGFDCIATAGEEAKSPRKSIPIAIVVSLLIIFMAYFGISTVLTMMLPYYEQDDQAPLPHVYDRIGWIAAKYVVSTGAICGLLSALMGSMFPLPRIVYSMANDGLLFSFLGKVHPTFHTPFLGTLIAGLITGISATFFELSHLFTLMAVATLMSYTVVAICVLLLRYRPNKKNFNHSLSENESLRDIWTQLFSRKEHRSPSKLTFNIVKIALITFVVASFALAIVLIKSNPEYLITSPCVIVVVTVASLLTVGSLLVVARQPKGPNPLFAVPFVPWVPGFSIMMNVYLMTLLDGITWLRYLVWMVVGATIYFSYGIWNSKRGQVIPNVQLT